MKYAREVAGSDKIDNTAGAGSVSATANTHNNRHQQEGQHRMNHRCEDCSYSGSYFPNGVCPGCGSTRIRSRAGGATAAKARKPYRLLLACALWLYLVVEILRKLAS